MNLKVPASLRDKLREAADQNHRSMTAELIDRVSRSFGEEPFEDRVFSLEERVDMLESFLQRAYPDHF
ncbi:Arc family DNA-binding protein [Halomonas elongata]|uniref:Arc family DNA-binding protein n=1 Tax=Halomonas elongata TaxID=2746 RepID=UPI00255B3747|nr:Arc family DNA-binding protein [Halomonas elongata]MDL4860810.1 Arc family DNA-binding protein [Halomonas elongata]